MKVWKALASDWRRGESSPVCAERRLPEAGGGVLRKGEWVKARGGLEHGVRRLGGVLAPKMRTGRAALCVRCVGPLSFVSNALVVRSSAFQLLVPVATPGAA